MRHFYARYHSGKHLMLPKLLLWTSLFLSACVITARAQRHCATDLAIQQALQKNPKLAVRLQQLDKMARAFAETHRYLPGLARNAVITIPVVVHIVLQDPSVVSDEQVLSQIAVLNQDYTASNPDTSQVPQVWKSLIGNMQLQFCLAQRTPGGDPSKGIVRVTTSRSQFSINDACSAVKHAATGGSDAWDTKHYLNIWVCNLGGNNLGVATPPDMYPADEAGVAIQYDAFGTQGTLQNDFGKGRSATHEIGHYFGLYHPWGAGDGSCSPGDFIDDTPPQSREVYGCPLFPYVNDSCSPEAPGIMFMNFMEYVNDNCMEMFSNGQVLRMEAMLSGPNGPRASLLASDGCLPVDLKDRDASVNRIRTPARKICNNDPQPVIVLRNRGKETLKTVSFKYKVDDGTLLSAQWNGKLASLDSVVVTLPALNVSTGSHILTVYSDQPNGAADEDPVNDTAAIAFHLDPQAAVPFTEGFEGNTYPPQGWEISNPDGLRTWERTSVAAHSGQSSVVMPNLQYASNGPVDDLISPVFNISGADSAFLFFYVAAAVQSDPDGANRYWDTLEVRISRDCGQTSAGLYKKWGKSLITDTIATTADFVPTATQWRKDSIDLTAFIGQGSFQLVFRNITNFENNIYLDDIKIITREVNPNLKRQKVLVVPNPTSGILLVEFLEITPDLRAVDIYNSAGQLLFRKLPSSAVNNRIQFDLANEPNGVYFVKVAYADRSVVKKIIKVR